MEKKENFYIKYILKFWQLWPINYQIGLKQWHKWEEIHVKPVLETLVSSCNVSVMSGVVVRIHRWVEISTWMIRTQRDVQTAGLSHLPVTLGKKKKMTATVFVFFRPQLLKPDMECRIPSDTLTLPDTKMKNIYK